MSRDPRVSSETFIKEDTFDSEVRRPLCRILQRIRDDGYQIGQVHVDIAPGTSAGADETSASPDDSSAYLHELDRISISDIYRYMSGASWCTCHAIEHGH